MSSSAMPPAISRSRRATFSIRVAPQAAALWPSTTTWRAGSKTARCSTSNVSSVACPPFARFLSLLALGSCPCLCQALVLAYLRLLSSLASHSCRPASSLQGFGMVSGWNRGRRVEGISAARALERRRGIGVSSSEANLPIPVVPIVPAVPVVPVVPIKKCYCYLPLFSLYNI